MNKKLLIFLWVFILLACSLASPRPAVTPTVQVTPSRTPTATLEPPTPTMTGTATPDRPPECIQFDLTAEECLNSGSHMYTFTGIMHADVKKCRWQENKQSTITKLLEVDVRFSENMVELCYPDRDFCQAYGKTESNSYGIKHITKKSSFTSTLKFDSRGMSLESEDPDCPSSSTYILSE